MFRLIEPSSGQNHSTGIFSEPSSGQIQTIVLVYSVSHHQAKYKP